MTLNSFDNYARKARDEKLDSTEVAGRYEFQAGNERRIVVDVMSKLAIDSSDTLLEIGCGPGSILIPLSYLVDHATGIDSQPVLERLLARNGTSRQVSTLPGDFRSMELPEQKFSKILIYSVLHCLDDEKQVLGFVRRALSLLAPGGRLLVGDVPNGDKKARFAATEFGRQVASKWEQDISQVRRPAEAQPVVSPTVQFNDALVFELMMVGRQEGCETYLLPQPEGLPFCYTREDILFCSRA